MERGTTYKLSGLILGAFLAAACTEQSPSSPEIQFSDTPESSVQKPDQEKAHGPLEHKQTYDKETGLLEREEWFSHEGKRHREGGPALIEYSAGSVYQEVYYKNGKRHREGAPASYSYNTETGYLAHIAYYKDDKLHNEEGPALIEFYGEKRFITEVQYAINGEYHRENGPAFMQFDWLSGLLTKEIYYVDGIVHREDGPAVTMYNYNGMVTKVSYIVNGNLHREDGPAAISYFEDPDKLPEESYYLNGKSVKEPFPSAPITYDPETGNISNYDWDLEISLP